jgi:hypothetical protein
MERLRDGSRKVVQVAEVQGMEGDNIVMQDIFLFEQTGVQNGRVVGQLKATGIRPRFSEKFRVNNIELPANILKRPHRINTIIYAHQFGGERVRWHPLNLDNDMQRKVGGDGCERRVISQGWEG